MIDKDQIVERDARLIASNLDEYAQRVSGPFAPFFCTGFQMALEFAHLFPADADYIRRAFRLVQSDMPADVAEQREPALGVLRKVVLGSTVA